MTLADRAKLATASRQQKAAIRASRLREALREGLMVKQAAHVAGVSQRTASRYLARA